MKRQVRWGYVLISLFVVGVGMSGCDTSVPLFENPDDTMLYYSLYGRISYPDGGTIRVEPLRDSILAGTTSEAPETVTFTRRATEEVDTLQVASREVEGMPVHNYRTPSGLTAGATYQIRVEGPEGNASTAQFTLPERPPDIEPPDSIRYCQTDGRLCPPIAGSFDFRRALPLQVRINKVKRLARVSLRYNTRFGTSAAYAWTNSRQKIDEDSYRIEVGTDEDLISVSGQNLPEPELGRAICDYAPPPPAIADSATITAVAAGPEWPGQRFNTANVREVATPNAYSNVEHGVGLVVGTYAAQEGVPVRVPTPSSLTACAEID